MMKYNNYNTCIAIRNIGTTRDNIYIQDVLNLKHAVVDPEMKFLVF